MANEVTVPLLPCGSIDVVADFYRVLGFRSPLETAAELGGADAHDAGLTT
jgi:hypothetical protein